ncbi:hypothetical protein BX600DRAFT_57966 [Xylariales sp. PMI_506]|nr:hypothetical protein BX600DRAFT_57966 [Xylariales sp. PMI_506]
MAELVGLAASIVTLCAVVTGSAKIASELHRAPEEIERLEKQVQVFRNTVAEIQKRAESGRMHSDSLTVGLLRKGEEVTKELADLLNNKIIHKGAQSYFGRRRVWLRYRTQLPILSGRMTNVREELVLALSAAILSSSTRIESSLVQLQNIILDSSTEPQELATIRRISTLVYIDRANQQNTFFGTINACKPSRD